LKEWIGYEMEEGEPQKRMEQERNAEEEDERREEVRRGRTEGFVRQIPLRRGSVKKMCENDLRL